jgi:hypothetical protein
MTEAGVTLTSEQTRIAVLIFIRLLPAVVAFDFCWQNSAGLAAGGACPVKPSGQLMQNAASLSTSILLFFHRLSRHGFQSANGANEHETKLSNRFSK